MTHLSAILFENFTGKNTADFEQICVMYYDRLVELRTIYTKIVIFFYQFKMSDENYKQMFSKYPEFQGYKVNNKRAEAGAIQGKAMITINTEELNKKTKDYREFIILEEFCHLVDDKGDSKPKGKEHLDFTKKYSERQNMYLAIKLTHDLDDQFKHYKVNRLLMKVDFEKWFKYRHAQYDKQLRQRTKSFYENITKQFPNESCTVIMIIELLMVISFLRAVESFKKENDLVLGNKNNKKLQQIMLSTTKTIDLLQKYTMKLDAINSDISSLFKSEVFIDEETYFREINKLFVKLKLIN
jgi:hypothetical protein